MQTSVGKVDISHVSFQFLQISPPLIHCCTF